ncbi:hypothetical protein ACFOHK_15870 [Falsigemmobacter intermedius]|nr:hypothetical protein [Falsigemmobacter intermedius]
MNGLKLLPLALCLLPCLAFAQAEAVLLEMSKRSHIPVDDIKASIEVCELNQRSMNLCALGLAVSAELAFDALQDEFHMFTPEEYAAFKAKVWLDCEEAGKAVADRGTMLAAEISLCIAAEYRARHRAMVEIQRIEAQPHPPHKWDWP